MGKIKSRDELDRTFIIFASDHGEMLGGHGLWQKHVPYEGSVRVPLIVSGPGVAAGAVSNARVELIDISATILELAGRDRPESWDSRSFHSMFYDPDLDHRDFTVSQLGDWRSITDRRWKLVSFRDGSFRLFDLEQDPAEMNPVTETHPGEVARLQLLLGVENSWMAEV